jgi:hypothetical protein
MAEGLFELVLYIFEFVGWIVDMVRRPSTPPGPR